jgi:hypothetical protein
LEKLTWMFDAVFELVNAATSDTLEERKIVADIK